MPILLMVGGASILLGMLLTVVWSGERDVPNRPPDLPPGTGKTRWSAVNALLGALNEMAIRSGIPLGLLVGWIAEESGGLLEEWGSPRAKATKYDERGYFQLMPDESSRLGLDHRRLSSDPEYSLNAGLLLIGKYMHNVDALNVAARGSSYYWRLVKLVHTMGGGAVAKLVAAAAAAGQAGSWDALERWSLANNAMLLSLTKHSPAKWFPFVDKVYATGRQFGFGSDTMVGGGEPAFNDIPDILDVLDGVASRS